MNHPAEYKIQFQSAISRIVIFILLLFCLVVSAGTDSWAEDMPFACNPSLYMTQGTISGSGPYLRIMVELNPNIITLPPTIIGGTGGYALDPFTNQGIKGPFSINGIAHSFNDRAIYAISEHNSASSAPGYKQGQHIYRIFKNSPSGIKLYDLGKPVNSNSAPNQLAGMYTGGTMVLWDQLNPALIGIPNPTIPHTSNDMESLMVVSTMHQGIDSPLWPWQNHLLSHVRVGLKPSPSGEGFSMICLIHGKAL